MQSQAIAQSSINGLYINAKGEFICIDKDTIQFRIYNKDAFGTFTIGIGQYKVFNKGKYQIIHCNSIINRTSVINQIPRNDSLIVIKLFYINNMPIKFAYVYIDNAKSQKKGSGCVRISDENGQLLLSDEQVNRYVNKEISIRIETIGFSTEKIVVLKRGYNYLIKSIMPEKYSFTVVEKVNILIKSLNAQEIEVERWIGEWRRKRFIKTKLNKVNVEFPCSHFLLDKNFTNHDSY